MYGEDLAAFLRVNPQQMGGMLQKYGIAGGSQQGMVPVPEPQPVAMPEPQPVAVPTPVAPQSVVQEPMAPQANPNFDRNAALQQYNRYVSGLMGSGALADPSIAAIARQQQGILRDATVRNPNATAADHERALQIALGAFNSARLPEPAGSSPDFAVAPAENTPFIAPLGSSPDFAVAPQPDLNFDRNAALRDYNTYVSQLLQRGPGYSPDAAAIARQQQGILRDATQRNPNATAADHERAYGAAQAAFNRAYYAPLG